jgi:2'-5' RNA ligase
MGIRSFIALDLREEILDSLGEAVVRLDQGGAKIRWVERANLHVTLRFLGEVADEIVAEVCGRAAVAAEQVAEFDFDVKGLTCVPPAGQLRMLWAGIDDATGEMAALHDLLAAELDGLDLHAEDRRFKPHLTLARMKYVPDPAAFRLAAAGWNDRLFGTQAASEIVVYSSKLTSDGPVYSPMAVCPLGG